MTTTQQPASTAVAVPPTTSGAPEPAPTAPLGYIAGFDGLRALGLVTILAYHHGFPMARGGIFTVSMFFTLSGFLIASLALIERERTGAFSMARFWERRVRRLLPAALVTVVAIVGLQHFAGVGSSARFRGDLLGALGYVANWRLAYSGGDYAAAFQLEAPVQHFWSLAVEEQFYLTFPLLFVGLLAAFRGRWRPVGAVLAAAAGLSFVAAWMTASRHGNSGIAYYATYTRASEILVGVALAFGLRTRPARRFLAGSGGGLAARAAGIVGIVGLGVLWNRVGLLDPFVFRGGTMLNAALTSLVIVACVQPGVGAAARFLGLWPLRNLGKISYGVYLFHWPLFLWLDHERTGLGDRSLFALRVSVTLVVAVASYHLLEGPFRRRGGRWSGRRLASTLALPALAVVALAVVVPVREPAVIDWSAFRATDGPLFADAVEPVGGAPVDVRVLLVGDSTSWSMLAGLRTWNERGGPQLGVDNYRAIGCTLAEPGPVRSLGELEEPTGPCSRFRDELPGTLRERYYDVIVVVMGHKDLSDRQVGGDEWRHFGDPVFDEWWRHQAAELADVLAVEQVPVLWSTAPPVRITRPEDPSRRWDDYPDNHAARLDRLNALLGEVVAGRPGMSMLDVAGWLQDIPGGVDDGGLRADGVHWTIEGSDRLGEWMAPQLVEAAGTVAVPD